MIRYFTEQECNTYSAEELAELFLQRAYPDDNLSYPINPFKFLADQGIPYIFRSFSKSEGIYVPASSDDDIPVVGINLKRPVQRQRFTAAHELCHHLNGTKFQIVPPHTKIRLNDMRIHLHHHY